MQRWSRPRRTGVGNESSTYTLGRTVNAAASARFTPGTTDCLQGRARARHRLSSLCCGGDNDGRTTLRHVSARSLAPRFQPPHATA